ncbi:MAG: G8 domain-containing protein [Pseudomonadota bacterium]
MNMMNMEGGTMGGHGAGHAGHGSGTIVQDLKGSGSVTLDEAIASQNMGSMHGHGGGDSGMMADMANLMRLFPDAEDAGVAVAINGGSWFDPDTWADGKVPVDGQDVYIPRGISVVYDKVSDERLDTVGVDGELHFAVATDTKLVLDTLVTGADSVLTIGTEDNPVRKDVSAEIIIHRDNGAINRAEDPSEFGKGIVTHGQVRIVGQDKADFLKTTDYPQAGEDFLIFQDMPMGWEVGDKLVVAGTEFVGANQFQDETVTIKSIQALGNGEFRVNLNETLQYDHDAPKHNTDKVFEVPVANYTRNILVATETDEAAYLGDGKSVPVDERGHIMFMHNPDVKVHNAEFFELGRTDKNEKLDPEDNVAGRYALHFHRTGGEVGEKPAEAEGNAVWGSPGWGIVHHDSNLDVISNAVFGVNGGAIIAEAGNEIGIWADNITMSTSGNYTTHNSEHSGDSDHPAGRQQELDDSFTQGIGFGFKSRLVQTFDNVAVSSNGAGYSYWPMGKEGGSPSHINPSASDYEALYGYDPFFGQDDTMPSKMPNRNFMGNEVIGSHVGLNTSADKRPTDSDVTTIIDNFTAWEVVSGVTGFYQRDYLIKDSTFVAVEGGTTSAHVNNATRGESSGIIAREFHELKIVNNTFEGFDYGIWESSHEFEEQFAHIILGNEFVDVGQDTRLYEEGASARNYELHDNSDNWVNRVDLDAFDATVNVGKSDLVMTEWFDRFQIVVDKTDSIGTTEVAMGSVKNRYNGASQKKWWQENSVNNGYYEENGDYYLLVDAVLGDRVTGSVGMIEVAIKLEFIDKPSDFPDGAKSNGPLPAYLDANGIGEFKIVDQREIGTEGDLLNPPNRDFGSEHQDHTPVDPTPIEPDPVEPDPVDPDPVDPDPVDPDPVDPDPIDPDPVVPDPVDPKPVDPAPAQPTPGEKVFKLDGSHEFNGTDETVKVYAHTEAMELSEGTISFTFNADQVTEQAGLISKDAQGYSGGGHHLSASIEDGILKVRFQDGSGSKVLTYDNVQANRDYDVDITFGDDGVALAINGEVVDSDNSFQMNWEQNDEYLQVGALGGRSETGESTFHASFDGTISDVSIAATDIGTSDAKMEVGTLNVAQLNGAQWHTVKFAESIEDAVVVMGPLSLNGTQGATARVRDVTSEGFQFQVDEWDYLDGIHTMEEVSWVAASAGTWEVDGTTVQFGKTTGNNEMQNVALDKAAFGGDEPVIMTQIASDNDGSAALSQIWDVDEDSFQFHIIKEEAAANRHPTEDVHWMAVGDGGGLSSGTISASNVRRTVEGADSDDAFFAARQTENGLDTAALRYMDNGNGKVAVLVQEEQSLDAELVHTQETIGWLSLQNGTYDLG